MHGQFRRRASSPTSRRSRRSGASKTSARSVTPRPRAGVARRFIRSRRITIQDAAWKVMPTAYNKASANGTLPVQPRQIMYAARGYIQEKTGRKLDDRYFTQTILPDYVDQNGVDWDIVWDARGSLHEPHTNRHVPLGTLEVRDVPGRAGERLSAARSGRRLEDHRRQGSLWRRPVRREGRLSAAVPGGQARPSATTSRSCRPRGVSTTAARTLIDRLVGDKVPVFCIRDFDVSGFTIAGTLAATPDATPGRSQGAIDLGRQTDGTGLTPANGWRPAGHPVQRTWPTKYWRR